MTSDKKKNEGETPAEPVPSTGEGADSALDALRRRRAQVPPADPGPPSQPPKE